MTINIIDTLAPLGSFPVANFKDISSPSSSQSVWYVDPIAGLDSNTGIGSGTALQTCHELRRRLRITTISLYEIHVLNDLPPTDYIGLEPALELPATVNGVTRVFWYGQRTVVRSGTFTANGSAAVPVSQQAPQFTDSTLADWNTHRGRLLVVTSGASAGVTAWCCGKDDPVVGAGISNCTPWHVATYTPVLVPGFTLATPPLVGDAYQIVDLTKVSRCVLHPRISQVFINFDFTQMTSELNAQISAGPTYVFSTCKLSSYMKFTGSAVELRDSFLSSLPGGFFSFTRCAVSLYFSGGRNVGTDNYIIALSSVLEHIHGLHKGGIRLDNGSIGYATGMGSFNTSNQAISAGQNSLLMFFTYADCYGTGHVQAVLAGRNSGIHKPAAMNLYFVGLPFGLSTLNLVLMLKVSFIPPLVPGLVVPVMANMQTWAELAAAPFNGACYDSENGAYVKIE